MYAWLRSATAGGFPTVFEDPNHSPEFAAHWPSSPVQVKSLMSHRLIEPTFHLEDKICKKHERLLEVYCRTDHACICTACAEAVHKSHDTVSTDHEWKKKMVSHCLSSNVVLVANFPIGL